MRALPASSVTFSNASSTVSAACGWIATLRSPKRIEDIATSRLRLVEPKAEQAIVIERVATPAPPAKSIIAAR